MTSQEHTDVVAARPVTTQYLGSGYDVVLLSVKATALGQALDDVVPAMGPDTVIVPFLNGIAHMDVLNERFGPRRVLGAAVRVISTLDADGTIVPLAPLASITVGAQDGTPRSRTEVEHVFGDLTGRARTLGVATPLLDAATVALRVHDARLGMPPG